MKETHDSSEKNLLNFFQLLLELDRKHKRMKKLYLDIDGVLLTKQGLSADHLVEFLSYATEHFDCYWLTTHCDGDATKPFLHLVGKVPSEASQFLEKIKPTKWKLWKPEAIDFSSDFFWLDDYAFEGDKKILEENQALGKLITIDLKSNPDQLIELVNVWKSQNL